MVFVNSKICRRAACHGEDVNVGLTLIPDSQGKPPMGDIFALFPCCASRSIEHGENGGVEGAFHGASDVRLICQARVENADFPAGSGQLRRGEDVVEQDRAAIVQDGETAV